MTVAIVDNGGANLNSLQFALQRLGARSQVCRLASEISAASHIILPGVGHAADSMQRLRNKKLAQEVCESTRPVLGICLGMQLMYQHSEEGDTEGLGIFEGAVVKLTGDTRYPSPHMGWNAVKSIDPHPIFAGLPDASYFYFVHGYFAPPGPDTIASSEYRQDMTSVVARNNFIGTQFHPEKSGPAGARLLRNFIQLS